MNFRFFSTYWKYEWSAMCLVVFPRGSKYRSHGIQHASHIDSYIGQSVQEINNTWSRPLAAQWQLRISPLYLYVFDTAQNICNSPLCLESKIRLSLYQIIWPGFETRIDHPSSCSGTRLCLCWQNIPMQYIIPDGQNDWVFIPISYQMFGAERFRLILCSPHRTFSRYPHKINTVVFTIIFATMRAKIHLGSTIIGRVSLFIDT